MLQYYSQINNNQTERVIHTMMGSSLHVYELQRFEGGHEAMMP